MLLPFVFGVFALSVFRFCSCCSSLLLLMFLVLFLGALTLGVLELSFLVFLFLMLFVLIPNVFAFGVPSSHS